MSAPASTAGALAAANRRGIVYMALAMASFIVNDSLIKLASESMPAAQAIAVRGLFATAFVLAAVLAAGHGRDLRHLAEPNVAARAAFDTVGTFSYLFALFHLPLANATAINMAAPLVICALAALVLKESVGWRRWSAVGAGFIGVLLVVRPLPGAFDGWALLCLGATFLLALRDIFTRRIAAGIPSIVVTLSTAAMVTAVGCVWATVEGWRPMTGAQIGLLAAASVFLAGGYYGVTVAMRAGELSVTGSFRYTGLLAALAIDLVVWRHVPDGPALAGSALLVCAGLYILHRERVRAREAGA